MFHMLTAEQLHLDGLWYCISVVQNYHNSGQNTYYNSSVQMPNTVFSSYLAVRLGYIFLGINKQKIVCIEWPESPFQQQQIACYSFYLFLFCSSPHIYCTSYIYLRQCLHLYSECTFSTVCILCSRRSLKEINLVKIAQKSTYYDSV